MVSRRARFKRCVDGSSNQSLVWQFQFHLDEFGVVARYFSSMSLAEHAPVLDYDGTHLRMMVSAAFRCTLPRLFSGCARELPQRIAARDVWVGLKPTDRLQASRSRRYKWPTKAKRTLLGVNGEARSQNSLKPLIRHVESVSQQFCLLFDNGVGFCRTLG
jgi:hypothetical protein